MVILVILVILNILVILDILVILVILDILVNLDQDDQKSLRWPKWPGSLTKMTSNSPLFIKDTHCDKELPWIQILISEVVGPSLTIFSDYVGK